MSARTANLALPYPEGTDPTSGNSQLEELASAVDAMAAPVFHPATWNSGYTDRNTSGYVIAFGRVWWQGGCTAVSGNIATGVDLMTVPEEARPVESEGGNEYFAIPVGSGKTGYVTFYPSGGMRITVKSSLWTPGNWLCLDGCNYPARM